MEWKMAGLENVHNEEPYVDRHSHVVEFKIFYSTQSFVNMLFLFTLLFFNINIHIHYCFLGG